MPESDIKRSVAAMFKRPLLAGALAATAVAAPGAANAAGDIFLRLDGIQGESTDDKHKNEIDILSFSLGFTNTTSIGSGSVGKVACGDVVVTKGIDKSSPSLIGAVMTGKHIKSGILTFRTEGKQLLEYYVLTMTDLVVTSINQSDSTGGPRVFESVSLNAAKFKFEYKPQRPDGSLDAARVFSFDCRANKTL